MGTSMRNAWPQVVGQAWADPAFRERLLNDPKTVLQEIGVDLPESSNIEILVDTPEVTHLVLPAKPAELDFYAGSMQAASKYGQCTEGHCDAGQCTEGHCDAGQCTEGLCTGRPKPDVVRPGLCTEGSCSDGLCTEGFCTGFPDNGDDDRSGLCTRMEEPGLCTEGSCSGADDDEERSGFCTRVEEPGLCTEGSCSSAS